MQWIIDYTDIAQKDLSSIEVMHHGAAMCPTPIKSRWLELLGPERVRRLRDRVSSSARSIIRGDEWLEHQGSVGRPIRCKMRILGPDGTLLQADEVGLVYMKSDEGARTSLFGPPSEFPTGRWLPNGGRPRMAGQGHGYLYLAGRADDVIIVGGINVYPAEIEAVIATCPGVVDTAVVGSDDSNLGQCVHAFVQRDEVVGSLEAKDVIAYCRQHLTDYKSLGVCHSSTRLPRTRGWTQKTLWD